MRNVMKKAWEIARQGAEKFGGKAVEYISEALRMAWAIVKKGANKMIEMKGTEKQVKWANDVYPKAIESVSNVLEEMKEWANKKRGRALTFPHYAKFFEEMKEINDASFWIDNFGYNKECHDFVNSFNRYVDKRKEEIEDNKAIYNRITRMMDEASRIALKQFEQEVLNK